MSPEPSSTPGSGGRSFEYITNSDAISGVAVHPQTGHLWTIGWGGVAEWDPATESVTVYTVADGLPSMKVSAVAAAPDGRVWVGTRGSGAAYHSPSAGFSPFSTGEGQWANDVLSLDLDPDGSVWIGTSTEAVRVAPDDSLERPGVPGTVTSTARDGVGNRWFGLYFDGLTRLGSDGRVTRIHAADGVGLTYDAVLNLAADPAGRVWVLSGDYLERDEGVDFQPAVDVVDQAGNWTHVDTAGWLQDGAIRDVAFDPAGDAWFASDEGIFAPQSGGTWRRETDTGASDVDFDSDGVLWAATQKGLERRDPSGEWRTLARGALPGSSVQSIDIAADGTAWFGTGGGGLARLGTDGSWRAYTETDGLVSPNANAVAVDGDGGVWFASADYMDGQDIGGAHYLSPDGVLSGYRIADGLVSGTVADIALADDGAWFASGTYFYAPGERRDGGVAFRGTDGVWLQFSQPSRAPGPASGLPRGGDVRALAVEPGGTVWAGADIISGAPDQSLARLEPSGAWEIIALPSAAPGDPVLNGINDLAVDADGNLWVATKGRVLLRYAADGTWLTPDDDPALEFWADAITVDQAGATWFATSDGVRILHPDGTWETITRADGLGFDVVRAIAIGPDGRAWVAGGEGGVTVISP